MTTSRSRWQFSLRGLFVLTAVVAVGIVLWQWCPVTGVSFSGTDVVFHLSDDLVQEVMPRDPYSYPFDGSSDTLAESPDVFFHDAYVMIPIYTVVAGLLIVVGCFVVLVFVQRRRANVAKQSQSDP